MTKVFWKWLTIQIVLRNKQWHSQDDYIVKGITNVPFCPISSKYSVDFDRNPRITGHSSHFTAQIYFNAGLSLVWILFPVCQVFPFVFKHSMLITYWHSSAEISCGMKSFSWHYKIFPSSIFTIYFRLQTIPNYLNDPLTFLSFLTSHLLYCHYLSFRNG